MSSGFSKNRTRTGSFSKEARICSKANDHSISGELGFCSLRPTSSILRRRLVTVAMALYRDSSSGCP
uniref:Uncharacterized protein n=1 Tax=Erpetoichthys calabaricus TaxID=27687 RepID=A0A8C4SF14_ERPCA